MKIYEPAFETGKIEGVTWHTLRHTFASGCDGRSRYPTVQELMGHSTIMMTMRYAHLPGFHLRKQ